MGKKKATPLAPQEKVNAEAANTILTETPIVKETPVVKDPVEEAQEIVNDRKVKVFWHKQCTNVKESTLTTLYAKETLKITDGKVSVPSEENPEELVIKNVYSLKRGKRIYYLYDVTPQDIVKAEQEAVKVALEKTAEREAKEALNAKDN